MLEAQSHQGEKTDYEAPAFLGDEQIARVLPSKTPVFHQGDDASHFYKVNSGVIMVYRLLEDGQRQITGFYARGDFFGMTPDAVHHDNAIAVGTSSVIGLTLADVKSDPNLQSELYLRTCCQLEDVQNMMMTLTKKSSGEKVAAFLVSLAKRQNPEHCSEEWFDLDLPMSRQDIADYLGMTIETVSRRLTDLKLKGLINLPTRHSAKIHHIEELENIAGALH